MSAVVVCRVATLKSADACQLNEPCIQYKYPMLLASQVGGSQFQTMLAGWDPESAKHFLYRCGCVSAVAGEV